MHTLSTAESMNMLQARCNQAPSELMFAETPKFDKELDIVRKGIKPD